MSTRPRERPATKGRLQVHEASCSCTTKQRLEFVDVTEDIQRAVSASGIRAGRVTVFCPNEHCPIVVNERESGLLEDIRGALDRRLPEGDGNAAAGSVGSRSVVLPVVDGRARLGTWQRILLLELGRPGDRSAFVQIVGE